MIFFLVIAVVIWMVWDIGRACDDGAPGPYDHDDNGDQYFRDHPPSFRVHESLPIGPTHDFERDAEGYLASASGRPAVQ